MLALIAASVRVVLDSTTEVIDGHAVPITITCQEDNPCWVASLNDDRFPRMWMVSE